MRSSASRRASCISPESPARAARPRRRSCCATCLAAAGRRPGLVGTVEWMVGGERRPAPFTTPEAIDLQRLFREMLDAGRSQRRDRGVVARLRVPAARPGALRRARLHEPVSGPPRLARDDGGVLPRQARGSSRAPQPPPAAVNVGDPWVGGSPRSCEDAARAPLVTFGLRDDAEVAPRTRADARREPLPRGRHRRWRRGCAASSTSRTCSARSRPGCCSTSTRTRSSPESPPSAAFRALRGGRRGPGVHGRRRLLAQAGVARRWSLQEARRSGRDA